MEKKVKGYQNLKEVYPVLKRFVQLRKVAILMGCSSQALNFKFNRTQFFTLSDQKAFTKALESISKELELLSAAVAAMPVRSEE